MHKADATLEVETRESLVLAVSHDDCTVWSSGDDRWLLEQHHARHDRLNGAEAGAGDVDDVDAGRLLADSGHVDRVDGRDIPVVLFG